MKLALLLIALGYGYKVFADATKEQGSLKTVGRLIGVSMMAVVIGLGAVKVAKCALMLYCPGKVCATSACPISK